MGVEEKVKFKGMRNVAIDDGAGQNVAITIALALRGKEARMMALLHHNKRDGRQIILPINQDVEIGPPFRAPCTLVAVG